MNEKNVQKSILSYKIRMRLPIGKRFAEIIKKALDPENYVYIKLSVEGDDLIVENVSDNVGSLLHTIDDFFWCFLVSYEIIKDASRYLKESYREE